MNTEIQSAIEKLPPREKKALSVWLLSQADDGIPLPADTLAEMAADPQMRAELRRIDQEFAPTETDGLGRAG